MKKRLTATVGKTFYDIYIRRPRKLEHGQLDVNTFLPDGTWIKICVPLKCSVDDVLDVVKEYYPSLIIPDKMWIALRETLNEYFEKERAKKKDRDKKEELK